MKLNQRKGSRDRTGVRQRPGKRVATKSAAAHSPVRRFCVGFAGMVLLPLAILFSLAAGIGYFRLQQGPISVNFLVDPIRYGINQGLPGLSATFDNVILTLAETGGLELRLSDLQLSESNGDVVVSAPQAAIGLSAGSLWALQAAPERVELIEPRISLFYRRNTGLSLDFDEGEGGEVGEAAAGRRPIQGDGAEPVDLADIITSTVKYTREAGGTSTLSEVGLRNATVVLDAEGRTTFWQVPRLLIDVERRSDRSIVSGAARVSSAGRIWTASFRLEDPRDGQTISVSTALRDVVPRQFAAALPGVDYLGLFDAPTSADIEAQFTAAGRLIASHIAVEVAGARIQPKGMDGPLLTVDAGVLKFAFDPSAQQVELKPSALRIGDASLQLSGVAGVIDGNSQAPPDWSFDIRAAPAVLGDASSDADVVALRSGLSRGRYVASEQKLLIEELNFDLGGGGIKLTGEIDTGAQSGARLEGGFSGMPVSQLAALWPRGLASGGRAWARENIRGGRVKSGTITYLRGRHLAPAQAQNAAGETRFVMAMEAENVSFVAADGMPTTTGPRVLARFENETLEVTMPEGSMDVGTSQIQLSKGRFIGSDMLGAAPSGQGTFSFEGPAQAIGKLFETPVLARAVEGERLPSGVSGKVSGDAAIGFPLDKEIAAEDIGYDITARLSQGVISGVLEGEDIKGASLDIHAAAQAVEVKGDVLIRGVLAKVNWQRIKADSAARQPPARLTATLDRADRKQLGIALNEFLDGEVPIEVRIENPGEIGQAVHVRADLTPAALSLGMIAWKKPAGREAFLDFDVVDTASGDGKILSNLRVTGSDIAVEGEVELDSKWRAKQFRFPNFSLDLVSRLNVSGQKSKDRIWKIKLGGKTYEGRAFFRSLFSVGDGRSAGNVDKREGYDITAKIDNMIGFEEVALRGLSMSMSMRGGQLSGLEGRGVLTGGQPMAFELNRERGRRLIRVDTSDAGQAFKLVGFYPNMVGGRLRLEVDLDGSGDADKTGTLWVESFRVLGDPIVSEVVGSVDESVPAIARKQHVVRQAFDFDSLRAPFSVGHGQIAIQEASMNGALLGATLRGTADFNQKTVDLGGTYVFLQGLNNVFAAIPLLGELLSGPRKEGVFGTNYAIRGSMDRPQVFVHPLSTLAPGIFREIFQLAPESQKVSPRQFQPGSARPRARSSSSPAAVGTPVAPGRTIEGWNSNTTPN